MNGVILSESEALVDMESTEIVIKKRNDDDYQILKFKVPGFASDYGRGIHINKKTVLEIMQSYPGAFL